jgi:protein gp37
MAKSNIDWTEHVWNPIAGCTKCSPGCENCYAEKMSGRLANMGQKKYGKVVEFCFPERYYLQKWNNIVYCDESALEIPLNRKKPTIYFVCSMSDLFHPKVPFEFIDKIMAVFALCPHHTGQILTKRADRMLDYSLSRSAMDDSYRVDRMPQWYHVVTEWLDQGENGYLGSRWDACETAAEKTNYLNPLPNLHFGVSISTQKEADEKMPVALQIPGFDFISLEPLLEDICLTKLQPRHWSRTQYINALTGSISPSRRTGNEKRLNSAIIGCESRGRMAGRFQEGFIEAAVSLVEQCKAAGVKVFVKQIPHKGRVIRKEKDWPECWPKQLREQEKI